MVRWPTKPPDATLHCWFQWFTVIDLTAWGMRRVALRVQEGPPAGNVDRLTAGRYFPISSCDLVSYDQRAQWQLRSWASALAVQQSQKVRTLVPLLPFNQY